MRLRPIAAITRQRAVRIQEMAAEGKTIEEIAREIGVSRSRALDITRSFNIVLAKPQTRRLAFYCARRRFLIIAALAEKAKVSPSTMVDRIVSLIVDDGLEVAERKLGKLAHPVRPRDAAPDMPRPAAQEPAKREGQRKAREAKAKAARARAERERAALAAMKRRLD